MRLLTAVVILAVGILGSAITIAFADGTAAAGSCYTISDPDTRNYCRAKARHDSSTCYSIQRQDLRAMCLSETRN